MAGRRKGLSDRQIAQLPRRVKRYAVADPELRGHYLRVPPSGPIRFTVVVKKGGKQEWEAIGTAVDMTIEQAREKARVIIRRIKSGEPPPMAPQSVAGVAREWLSRHVDRKQLRTASELRRICRVYIEPHIGDRDFTKLRRSDIVAFLDVIEDKHGASVADLVLSTMRSISAWFEQRTDDYVAPFSRAMRRVSKAQRARARVLSDDEIRTVWQAAERAPGRLGPIIKLLLLTGQRRAKVYWMRWQDIDEAGIWTVPADPGEKGNGGRLRLPPAALAIIREQPELASSPYVFAERPAPRSVSAFHDRLDIPDWRLHDLRRTARTLMSRIGVDHFVAEAILGHRVPGVAGVYDRYAREAEKGHALARLAATIEQIVNPTENVVPLRA